MQLAGCILDHAHFQHGSEREADGEPVGDVGPAVTIISVEISDLLFPNIYI